MIEYRNSGGDAPCLHLASASARRVDLLQSLGLSFSAAGVDIDESQFDGEPATDMVQRLATSKARAAAGASKRPILGSDTVVVHEQTVFGKPASQSDALRMLDRLSGGDHEVLTAVAVLYQGQMLLTMSATRVRFRDITPDEMQRYWQTGEPQGKAGAYAIQGIAGVFVEAIEGSYSGVVGLPVYETAKLLQDVNIDVPAIAVPERSHPL